MHQNSLQQIARNKGYGQHKRHIFLCMAQGPCTDGQPKEELWEYLKNRLRELEPDPATAKVARSKSGCLRVCAKGPIALVYPEGTMYFDLDKQKLERIIVEHLIGGKPVLDFAFFESPLQED